MPLPDGSSFPVLPPSGMISYLAASDNMGKLCGELPNNEIETTLQEFWRRYSHVSPSHQVYESALAGRLRLCRTFPAYVHGDEGRGLKKSGVLLLSLQGALGRGTRCFWKRCKPQSRRQRMGVNIAGSSYSTRLLYACMPKQFYQKSAKNYDALLSFLTRDLKSLEAGFDWKGETWHIVVLGLKGDMPFLAKTGKLSRHYLRATRKESSQGKGVCWLCPAGKNGCPYEDFNPSCAWATTHAPEPWSQCLTFCTTAQPLKPTSSRIFGTITMAGQESPLSRPV